MVIDPSKVPKEMKAIQVLGPGQVEIVKIPVPKIGPNEVLVKVRSCVTCPHWDMTLYQGIDILARGKGYPEYPRPPGQPGHEMAGDVVAVGSQVKTFKSGDRVATTMTANTVKELGFYAEYAARPEDVIVKIPDNVTYEEAAPMEMAVYLASYIRWLGNLAGKRVGVSGLGPAGLMGAQMVRAQGSREVVLIEPIPERRKIAEDLGFQHIIDPTLPGELEALRDAPLEASVDCSGVASSLQNLMEITNGFIVIFGILHGNVTYGLPHWRRQVCLVHPPSIIDNPPSRIDCDFVVELMRDRKLITRPLISASLPFEEYIKGVKMLVARKAIKVSYHP